MLKMNIFMFTITMSIAKRKMTGAEYEDHLRIEKIRQDLEKIKQRYYRY